MSILDQIELQLYRFAQGGYHSEEYALKAKHAAADIYNLVDEYIKRGEV